MQIKRYGAIIKLGHFLTMCTLASLLRAVKWPLPASIGPLSGHYHKLVGNWHTIDVFRQPLELLL